MKKLFILISIISIFLISCKSDSNDEKTEETVESVTDEIATESVDYLSIVGKDIWVRSKPTDGDVVMKLNDGDECKIIEKGKQETIKGTTDYWYKIEFEGKEGWVFGSQTSIKEENTVTATDKETLIKNLIDELVVIFDNQQFAKLKSNYYLGNKVFIISNPGVYVIISLKESDDFLYNYNLSSAKDCTLKFEKWPEFDMESYQWDKHGCFVEEISKSNYFSTLVNDMKEFGFEPSADEIKYASELDKVTTYKILITENNIRFYIAEKDGKWLITAIDYHDFSA